MRSVLASPRIIVRGLSCSSAKPSLSRHGRRLYVEIRDADIAVDELRVTGLLRTQAFRATNRTDVGKVSLCEPANFE